MDLTATDLMARAKEIEDLCENERAKAKWN
jgi:hypothetical protein